jgi:hypothetical protein
VPETLGTLESSTRLTTDRTHLATVREATCETGRVIVPERTLLALAASTRALTERTHVATLRATMCETGRVIVPETLGTLVPSTRLPTDRTHLATVREAQRTTARVTARGALCQIARVTAREKRESPRSGDCWRHCARVRSLPERARRCCGGWGNMRSAIRNTN